MGFSIPGRRKRSGQTPPAPAPPPVAAPANVSRPLTTVRVGNPRLQRTLGRRSVALEYDRVFIPSLVVDHTELMLRQHGAAAKEGFGLWAGTLAGGDAFVSTLVIPGVDTLGRFHGVISDETTAAVLDELDHLDLVPIVEIHSHPREAFLSPIDAERPLVAVKGFLSVVVPSFGFIDLADVGLWRVYEFHGRDDWAELDEGERRRRLIIDPSLLRIE
jgi:hypothetical protein